MYFIVFLVAIIFSAILSLVTSGIISLGSHKDWWSIKDIPVGYYFAIYNVLIFGIFKLYFRNVRVFKIFLLRSLIKFNWIFKKIDNKVYSTNSDLNSLQEKSIGVWNLLLSDKSTTLNASLKSYSRSIQRGSLLIVLKGEMNDQTLIVMDTDGLNLFYEVYIPQTHSKEMASYFDKENEKRISSLENKKRIHLESQLSRIIKE